MGHEPAEQPGVVVVSSLSWTGALADQGNAGCARQACALESEEFPMYRPGWLVVLGIVCLACLAAPATVQATPLNLTLAPFPDISSGFITLTYDAGSGAFNATGFAFTLEHDGVPGAEFINSGTFTINALISNAGVLSPGGTLVIGGDVPTLGFPGPTLLSGNLTALGFPDSGGDPLEFLFTVTGGDAAGLYGGIGAVAGIILTQTNFPSTAFTESFTREFAVADVAPLAIPEPTSIGLGIACGLGLLFARRRQLQKMRMQHVCSG
jgi:hypothetical protein